MLDLALVAIISFTSMVFHFVLGCCLTCDDLTNDDLTCDDLTCDDVP